MKFPQNLDLWTAFINFFYSNRNKVIVRYSLGSGSKKYALCFNLTLRLGNILHIICVVHCLAEKTVTPGDC